MMGRNSARHAWVPVGSLKPYDGNVRQHNRHQRRKIFKLVDQIGMQIVPVIVTPDLEIIDGHALYETMRERGAAEVFVAILENQSPAEIKALRLAINRVPQDSRLDKAGLKKEISGLIELSFDLELTGFDVSEIDSILRIDIPEANVVEDEESIRLTDDPVAQTGDIFQLGPHRIGCGSAHNRDFLYRLREGRAAEMCFIDPPYNVPIAGFVSGRGRTKHGDFVQGAGELSSQQFFEFLQGSLEVLRASVSPRALIYACIDWRHILELTAAGRALGLELLNVAVWVKSNAGMGNLYRSRHELICIFAAGTEPHHNNVELGRFGRNRTNVWEYPGMSSFDRERDELLSFHPTVKPVALIADALRDVTKRGDAVIDTFLGSGSTLIAAEEVGRTCFGVELDARYIDVAIRRWQQVTGRDAINVASGERFDDLASPRQATRRLGHGA